MQLTRREILDEFLYRTSDFGDDLARQTAGILLSRALKIVAGSHNWRQLVSTKPYRVTTTPSVRSYVLPPEFGRTSGVDGRVRNLTTGGLLDPIEQTLIETIEPEIGTVYEQIGEPQRYDVGGTQGVHTQPSSEAVQALSSSASDTSVLVTVEGLNTSNQWTRARATLMGATPVALGAWSFIQYFSKAYPSGITPPSADTSSVGTVTLQTVAAATQLQVLFAEESGRELRTISFDPTPDAAYVISVPYLRSIRPMVNDADTCPDGWDSAIIEEMRIQRMIDDGEMSIDSQDVPRPSLLNLKMQDNASAAQAMRHRRPFVR